MDDTFCLLKDKQDIYLSLYHINSYHPNIRFTVDIEENGTLPFLDILVNKDSFLIVR